MSDFEKAKTELKRLQEEIKQHESGGKSTT
jgi:hypothetical protein